MADDRLVLVSRSGDVTTLTLHRPEALNAITDEMLVASGDALEVVAGSTPRVVVLTGSGRAFSAGVDLKALGQRSLRNGMVGDVLDVPGRRAIDLLTTIPQIVIAKVNGFCFTGALELVLACDLAVAADGAKFGDTHAKFGLRPTWGMSQRLVAAVGITRARELSYTARTFTGADAARWGLVADAVPADELDGAVDSLAATIAANSAGSLAAYKDLFGAALDRGLRDGLAYEAATGYEIPDTEQRVAALPLTPRRFSSWIAPDRADPWTETFEGVTVRRRAVRLGSPSVSAVVAALPPLREVSRTLRLDGIDPTSALPSGMGSRDPSVRRFPGGLARAVHTPAGPGTVLFRWTDAGDVTVRAWGSTSASEWLLDAAPGWLGMADDVSSFRPSHPLVAEVWRRSRTRRLGASGLIWSEIVPTIVSQRVQFGDAIASWRRIVRWWGSDAPGPPSLQLVLPPSPEVLRTKTYIDLHRLDMERRRAEAVLVAARHAARMEEAASMSVPCALARLQALPGSGPWTATTVVAAALGDPDTVVVGDFWMPTIVRHALTRRPFVVRLRRPDAGAAGTVRRSSLASGDAARRGGVPAGASCAAPPAPAHRPLLSGFDPRHVGCLAGVGLGGEERVEHLLDDRRRREPQSEREHVGIVPATGAAGGVGVGAQRGPHAWHLVGGDRHAGPRPARHDTQVATPRRDELADVTARRRARSRPRRRPRPSGRAPRAARAPGRSRRCARRCRRRSACPHPRAASRLAPVTNLLVVSDTHLTAGRRIGCAT